MSEKPELREGVIDSYFDDADAFLDALSARAEAWSRPGERWVFRGQRDARWGLRPSGARGTPPFDVFKAFGVAYWRYRNPDASTPSAVWALRENWVQQTLDAFRDHLNAQGLVVPLEAPKRSGLSSTYHSGDMPERELFPLMALAQHHGLPTLFLDWTTRAWNAAYFAAASAAERLDESDHIAVWALVRTDQDASHHGSSALNFYVPPTSTNPNLRAQLGLFTWFSNEHDRSLEEQVSWLNAQEWAKVKHPALRRLMLPTRLASSLLRRLALEGVDAASMYPGADGIVKCMRERMLWDKAPT